MATSYIVMAGEYSDRHVCGVYSDRERAEYAARLFDGWVEEFEPDALPDHPKGTTGFSVAMIRDGTATVVSCGAELMAHYFGKGGFLVGYRRADDGSLWAYQEYRDAVWARDEQHAVKIVNERRGQLIAANEWPDDPHPPNQRGFASTGLFHSPTTETVLGDPIVASQQERE